MKGNAAKPRQSVGEELEGCLSPEMLAHGEVMAGMSLLTWGNCISPSIMLLWEIQVSNKIPNNPNETAI